MSMIDSILTTAKKEPEFYLILGCDKNSTKEQIKAEYRVRVLELHPDKSTDEKDNSSRKELFQKVQEAYSILTDDSKRQTYDSWLETPIPSTFEDYLRNSEAIRMATHWATSKSQPMISIDSEDIKNEPYRWNSRERYQSDSVSKFRNYQL